MTILSNVLQIEGKFALSQLAPFDIGKKSTLNLLFLFGPKYIQDIFCNYYSNENKKLYFQGNFFFEVKNQR